MAPGPNRPTKVTEADRERIERATEARGLSVWRLLRQAVGADLQESKMTGGRPVNYRRHPSRIRFLSTRVSEMPHDEVRQSAELLGANRSRFLADRAPRAARAVLGGQ